MKVDLHQKIGLRLENTVNTIKRIAKDHLHYVTNVFERSPKTDVFIPSTRFIKPNALDTDKDYIEKINNVPVLGVGKTEQPILNLVQESMFSMLKLTKGEATPYSEILFAHCNNPQMIACVYSSQNALCVNKSYLENIDSTIDSNIEVFNIMEWITKDKNGKYKIPDLLRNKSSEEFERLLNEYSPNWSLKDKFIFDTLITYYHNLASQALSNPNMTIEKIFKNEENCQLLKNNGLFEKRKKILPLISSQREYLLEIGKYCRLPEDTCLITYPEIVFNHEYIHKWCFDNFSDKYLAELHSKPVIQNWQDDKKIQFIANKVSLRATDNPMEYIAEVGAGLAGGQKFDKDVMTLYESLKGPQIVV